MSNEPSTRSECNKSVFPQGKEEISFGRLRKRSNTLRLIKMSFIIDQKHSLRQSRRQNRVFLKRKACAAQPDQSDIERDQSSWANIALLFGYPIVVSLVAQASFIMYLWHTIAKRIAFLSKSTSLVVWSSHQKSIHHRTIPRILQDLSFRKTMSLEILAKQIEACRCRPRMPFRSCYASSRFSRAAWDDSFRLSCTFNA